MKRPLIIISTIFYFLAAYSQSPVDFNKFATVESDTSTILTDKFLKKINWNEIKSFCTQDNGHYAYERNDSILTEYEYVKQGREVSFEIVSYKGMVLEYYADAGNVKPQKYSLYFNKNVFLRYVEEMMPSLPDQFKLSREEPNNILKAYYQLLGLNTRDEYGFVCEYSTVGRATARRMAVVTLLKQNRVDLIKKIAEYPNLQSKLYAIDALIYHDYITKEKIQQWNKDVKQKQKQLERVQQKDIDKIKITDLNMQLKLLSDSISYFNSGLLTDKEWNEIYNFRDSKLTVNTCGNCGSYKIYGTPIAELLSEKTIAEIPKQYAVLKRLGYFW